MNRSLTRRALDEHLPPWGVLVLESHHDVGFTMAPRTHRFLKFIYVLQGAGDLMFENSRQPFEVADCLIVPPDTPNWIEDDPQAASSLYICCIAPKLLEFDPLLLGRFTSGRLKRDNHVANRVASHLRRLAFTQSQNEESRPLKMVAEAMRLLQVIAEHIVWSPTSKPPKREAPRLGKPIVASAETPSSSELQAAAMRRYVRRLNERFFEATTIDDAAASIGLSRRAFTRAFSDQTGETWLHYVRRLAVEHAIRLLVETERPIAAIAFECGFNDLSTFYRQFKARTAMSPADFRRHHRQES